VTTLWQHLTVLADKDPLLLISITLVLSDRVMKVAKDAGIYLYTRSDVLVGEVGELSPAISTYLVRVKQVISPFLSIFFSAFLSYLYIVF